jgi:large subunit ribosomal protein L25
MEATLEAIKRDTKGKNEARRLRAKGQIPATIYGAQKEGDPGKSFPLAVDPKPLLRILHSESGLNTLITLKVDGEGESRVLVKEFQLDPVTHSLLHADFYRVNMDRKITVTVPLVFKGEPRGVKVEGGVLELLHREIEVETLPADIPDSIEVDVKDLGLNDAIFVRDVATNVRWTPISDPDMMVVHVVTPRAVEEPVVAEAAVVAPVAGTAEPEVIKKGKTEKEGEAPPAKEGGKKEAAKEGGKKEK